MPLLPSAHTPRCPDAPSLQLPTPVPFQLLHLLLTAKLLMGSASPQSLPPGSLFTPKSAVPMHCAWVAGHAAQVLALLDLTPAFGTAETLPYPLGFVPPSFPSTSLVIPAQSLSPASLHPTPTPL